MHAGDPHDHTLSSLHRYPNKLGDLKAYVDAEFSPIRRCGGLILGYFLPTDFARPTNEACGLIDFESLAAYESEHQTNVAWLEQSNALVSITRSLIRRAG